MTDTPENRWVNFDHLSTPSVLRNAADFAHDESEKIPFEQDEHHGKLWPFKKAWFQEIGNQLNGCADKIDRLEAENKELKGQAEEDAHLYKLANFTIAKQAKVIEKVKDICSQADMLAVAPKGDMTWLADHILSIINAGDK